MKNQQVIVLVVGPDMCGKTQIAKALAVKLGATYYKASNEHKRFLGDQNSFLNELRFADPARLDIIKQSGVSIVFDRGFPCEFVYSQYFGRTTDTAVLLELDRQYAELGAVIVFATRMSFDGISDDLDDRIGPEQLKYISSLYDTFIQATRCSVLKLYVDDEDLVRELTDIEWFMKGVKEDEQK